MVADAHVGSENRDDFPCELILVVGPRFDQIRHNGLAHVHGQGADEHLFLAFGALLDHRFVFVLKCKFRRALQAWKILLT